MLTYNQTFSAADIVPNLSAIAATAVVPSILGRTQGMLRQYGLFGDLVHVGAVGAVFAAFVYVDYYPVKMLTVLTMTTELPLSVHISWTATGGSAAASDVVVEAHMKLVITFAFSIAMHHSLGSERFEWSSHMITSCATA